MNRLFFQHETELDHATRHLRRRITARSKRQTRRDDRRPLRYDFTVYAPDGEQLDLVSIDLSMSGTLLECSDSAWFQRNPVVDLKCTSYTGDHPLYLEARVARIAASSPYDLTATQGGVALEFLNLDSAQQHALRTLLFGPRSKSPSVSPFETFSFQAEPRMESSDHSDLDDGHWLWAGVSP